MASLIGGTLALTSLTLRLIGGERAQRCFDALLDATIFRGIARRVQVRMHLHAMSLTCKDSPPLPSATTSTEHWRRDKNSSSTHTQESTEAAHGTARAAASRVALLSAPSERDAALPSNGDTDTATSSPGAGSIDASSQSSRGSSARWAEAESKRAPSVNGSLGRSDSGTLRAESPADSSRGDTASAERRRDDPSRRAICGAAALVSATARMLLRRHEWRS